MNPKRNDIYLALVDFADKPEAKMRPIVIISNNHYNDDHPDVISCSVTTNASHDCFIPLNQNHLQEGQFYETSGIRCDTPQRITKNKLKHKIGKITNEYHNKIVEKITELIK